MTDNHARLTEIEQCVIQILFNFGILEDSKFKSFFDSIVQDYQTRYPGYRPPLRDDLFKTINKQIRRFGIEIKTVIDRQDDENIILYHGIVNTEEDFTAKMHGGGNFDQVEIEFFNKLAIKLVLVGKFTTRDIEQSEATPLKWSSSEVGVVLEKLYAKKWLARDNRNYWVLGLRTFLELRTFIEAILRDAGEGEDEDKFNLEDLPQVIVY